MERLTFEGNFCDISMCQEPYPCKYNDTGCTQKQVWERLKQYEDAGLSPEHVKSLYEKWDDDVNQCTMCPYLPLDEVEHG